GVDGVDGGAGVYGVDGVDGKGSEKGGGCDKGPGQGGGGAAGEPAVRLVADAGGRKAVAVAPGVGGRRGGETFALALRATEVATAGASRYCLLVSDRTGSERPARPSPRAEARYRALVEQIPAVTFTAALDGGDSEMYVSPQIETLLGFSPREWLDDPVLWFERLHPDDRPLWREALARGVASGGPFRAECRVFARDGRLVWVRGEARLVRDEAGRPLVLQGVAFDITESKRALELLRDAQEAKLKHERLAAVGQIAASIGHDIRNPLGAVANAFYFLAKRVRASSLVDDPRVPQFLDVVEKELKAASGIVSELLDYARERPPALAACPLGPLVDDAFGVVAAPPHVRLVNEVPDALPAPALDQAQFRQALINLVQNAAEAIPAEREGVVRVGGAEVDGEVLLSIADNGDGIPDAIVGKVFEPLFTSKAKGTGLGLSIVANTVKRHGGAVEIGSTTGAGTTFIVRLPLRPRPPPAGDGPGG
ncbi:MAG TPA: ATP-binding protein, partial [Polyangiaceae bacterium]|nr:ATP-binding protein [Polyangiaceae bacterium]